MSWMFNEVEGLHFCGCPEDGIADFWCRGTVRSDLRLEGRKSALPWQIFQISVFNSGYPHENLAASVFWPLLHKFLCLQDLSMPELWLPGPCTCSELIRVPQCYQLRDSQCSDSAIDMSPWSSHPTCSWLKSNTCRALWKSLWELL